MKQLVGQLCVHCGERIALTLDGQFCAVCTCPVHNTCAADARSGMLSGHCAGCGAAAAIAEPRKQEATEIAQRKADEPRRKRQGCAIAAAAAYGGFAFLELTCAVANQPEDKPLVYDRIVGVILAGAVLFALIFTFTRYRR